jgi:hypothetical protein
MHEIDAMESDKRIFAANILSSLTNDEKIGNQNFYDQNFYDQSLKIYSMIYDTILVCFLDRIRLLKTANHLAQRIR